MKIIINYYQLKKNLLQEFVSASGTLNQKEFIIAIFKNTENNILFAFEFPFSPSMHESTKSFIQKIANNQFCFLEEVSNSYFINLFLKKEKIPYFGENKFKYNIQTLAIGKAQELNEISNTSLWRLKGSPLNLEELISVINTAKVSNIVIDFNKSLSTELFEKFLSKIDISKINYIEQPCAIETDLTLFSKKVKIFADESASFYKNAELLSSYGYSGVVIKPFLYQFQELKEFSSQIRRYKMDSIIGNMISDSLCSQFVGIFNSQMTIHVNNYVNCMKGDFDSPLSLIPHFVYSENNWKINPRSFENLLKSQEAICTKTLTLD